MVGKLRGTYPELLIASMLANSNDQVVKLRITPTFLSKYEDINGDLDVIGVLKLMKILLKLQCLSLKVGCKRKLKFLQKAS